MMKDTCGDQSNSVLRDNCGDQSIFNLIAELCAFVKENESRDYLVRYSCISEEEEERIEQKIERATPLAISGNGPFMVIREEDLTNEFLEGIRDFACLLMAEKDINAIMQLLQTLDGSLIRILNQLMNTFDTETLIKPLNTNDRETGIEIFPRCQCVWARKSRPYFSERRIDFHLKYLLVIEKERTEGLKDRHVFLPKGLFPVFDRTGTLKVAASPLSLQPDFSVHLHSHRQVQSFTLDYNRSGSERIERLVWKKITEAGETGAELLVFPEMMGSPDMEHKVQRKLQDLTEWDRKKIPSVIVLPTYFSDGKNCASVLDRDGHLLARQYKQSPYVMTVHHKNYVEAIDGAREVTIFHYPGIGRFAVMICKDFLTTRYMERIMRGFLLTLIIVPAYSTGAYDFRTSFETCAHDYCNVVWINSCAAMVPGKEKNFRYIGYTRKRITRYQSESDAYREMIPCRGLFSGKCDSLCLYYDSFLKV